MKTRIPTKLLLLICGLLLLVSGCGLFFRPTWPLLYKPSCDLSPVLAIQFPEHMDTLAGCPRDETVVENGINKNVGGRQPDDIKEFFYFRKGKSEFDFDIQYEFVLFYSDSAAANRYKSDTRGRWESKHYPIFKETIVDGCSACVHYTEQERADPEGGSAPMGIYHSRASFRLHNVFIHVTTQDSKPQNDKLTTAVKDLAQMLSVALASTNQIPK